MCVVYLDNATDVLKGVRYEEYDFFDWIYGDGKVHHCRIFEAKPRLAGGGDGSGH